MFIILNVRHVPFFKAFHQVTSSTGRRVQLVYRWIPRTILASVDKAIKSVWVPQIYERPVVRSFLFYIHTQENSNKNTRNNGRPKNTNTLPCVDFRSSKLSAEECTAEVFAWKLHLVVWAACIAEKKYIGRFGFQISIRRYSSRSIIIPAWVQYDGKRENGVLGH